MTLGYYGNNEVFYLFGTTYRKKMVNEGFAGGSVVKNPPASAGDVPDLGRSHLPRGS